MAAIDQRLTGVGALAPVESLALGILSQSTGSVLVDAAIGGAVGYFFAPQASRNRFAVGGAIATGLGGVLGLVGTVGFIVASNADSKKNRKRRRR